MAQSAGERYSASGRGAAKGFQLPCGMRPPNSGQPLDEVGSGKTARLSVPLGSVKELRVLAGYHTTKRV